MRSVFGSLLLARLNDEDSCGFLVVAGFLSLGVSPWAEEVLATTTGF
jgi:hypothetical protein